MKILFIIPARAGSKRLPGKNKKRLGGKPLICHTLEFAERVATSGDSICISSDDKDILDMSSSFPSVVFFDRPTELASDTASSFDVLLHAINCVSSRDIIFDTVVLLQPTTPFRSVEDFEQMKLNFINGDMSLYSSVCVTSGEHKNMIKYDLMSFRFTSDSDGVRAFLNGSIYFFNKQYLINNNSLSFDESFFYVMSEINSIDIDTNDDWILAEKII